MQYKYYHLWLNEDEIDLINTSLAQCLSELKGLPKECYTNIFEVNVSKVEFHLDILAETPSFFNKPAPIDPDKVIKGYRVDIEY